DHFRAWCHPCRTEGSREPGGRGVHRHRVLYAETFAPRRLELLDDWPAQKLVSPASVEARKRTRCQHLRDRFRLARSDGRVGRELRLERRAPAEDGKITAHMRPFLAAGGRTCNRQ